MSIQKRIRFIKKTLPEGPWKRAFRRIKGSAGLVDEATFTVEGTRLRAKLLLFKNVTALRDFSAGLSASGKYHALRGSDVSDALGYVRDCAYTSVMPGKKLRGASYWDRRYFAVMALAKPHIGAGILSHECLHLACSLHRRTGGRGKYYDNLELEASGESSEEALAYPLGAFVKQSANFLLARGHYEGSAPAARKARARQANRPS